MDYITIKYVHIACVSLSGLLFLLRGMWMLTSSPLREQRWIKVLPHLVDTVLLTSALSLAVMSAQYPFAQNWLTAKLLLLLLYIGLGVVALRRGTTLALRAVALVAAVAVFACIVALAVTKHVPLFSQ